MQGYLICAGLIGFLVMLLCYYVKKHTRIKIALKEAEKREELKENFDKIDDEFDTIELDRARTRMRDKVRSVSNIS